MQWQKNKHSNSVLVYATKQFNEVYKVVYTCCSTDTCKYTLYYFYLCSLKCLISLYLFVYFFTEKLMARYIDQLYKQNKQLIQ